MCACAVFGDVMCFIEFIYCFVFAMFDIVVVLCVCLLCICLPDLCVSVCFICSACAEFI